jgi:molybdopterin synthase sulfur carrier subunit
MAVCFLLPDALRPFAGGITKVTIDPPPTNVSAALEALWAGYPGLRFRIVNEEGQVRPHVNIFVGTDSIRDTGGLLTPLTDNDEIAIIPAVSGG